MEQENKLMWADPETGCMPTEKQLQIILVLNPLEYDRNYEQATELLGISESNIQSQMSRLKQRCPVIYEKFRKLRKKYNKNHCLSLEHEYLDENTLADKCYFSEDSSYVNANAPFVGGFVTNKGEFISFKIKEIF